MSASVDLSSYDGVRRPGIVPLLEGRTHDHCCPTWSTPTEVCVCDVIVEARGDERRHALDDVEALIRWFYREHGWHGDVQDLIDRLDRMVEP